MITHVLSDEQYNDLMPRAEHEAVKEALKNMLERAKQVIMEGRTCAREQCAACPVGRYGINICTKRFSHKENREAEI